MRLAYDYVGVDNTNRTVNGFVLASNAKQAQFILEEAGIRVYKLNLNIVKTILNLKKKTFTSYELRDLMFAFYNAQKSGLSLRMIVDSLPDMFTGYAKKQAEYIRRMIKEKGYQLSVVFKKAELPDFIVHAVEAAEVGGGLEEVLEKVVKVLDVMAKSESELAKALIYPKIVLALIIAVLFFLIWQVVPKLAPLYSDVPKSMLPSGTVHLMSISKSVNSDPYFYVFWVLVGIFAMWKFVSVTTFLNFVQLIYIMNEKMPTLKRFLRGFSEFIDSYETMKICYFLDLLYVAGIKPNKIVEYIRDIIETRGTKKKLEKAKIHIENGLPMFQSFQLAGFDKQLVGFIKAGEEQNSLSFYMTALAEYKERSFENAVEKVKTVMPMLLMILASTVIVSIMYYLILPLYSIVG